MKYVYKIIKETNVIVEGILSIKVLNENFTRFIDFRSLTASISNDFCNKIGYDIMNSNYMIFKLSKNEKYFASLNPDKFKKECALFSIKKIKNSFILLSILYICIYNCI